MSSVYHREMVKSLKIASKYQWKTYEDVLVDLWVIPGCYFLHSRIELSNCMFAAPTAIWTKVWMQEVREARQQETPTANQHQTSELLPTQILMIRCLFQSSAAGEWKKTCKNKTYCSEIFRFLRKFSDSVIKRSHLFLLVLSPWQLLDRTGESRR